MVGVSTHVPALTPAVSCLGKPSEDDGRWTCLNEGQRLRVERVWEVHGGHARPLPRAAHDLAPHLPRTHTQQQGF